MANQSSQTKKRRSKSLDRDRASIESALGITYEGSVPFGTQIEIARYRLPNGLTVLLAVDHSAPVVAYHTWFRVGSRHERDGKTGIAHLLEHLMFNEFEGLKPGEIDRLLEEAGAETNAATWLDWTFYYENLPSNQLHVAVDLEAMRMGKLVMQEQQVSSEREVVMNERRYRVEDDVEGAVSEELYARAFCSHSYRTPTIGWMRDIQGLTPQDVEAFYRTYYAPNNASLVLVGDFDEMKALRRIAEAYGYLKPAQIPVEQSHPEPPQVEERTHRLHKPTATHKVAMAYHAPALGDRDHVPLGLLCDVLFGGRASRAYRALVRDSEIATEVRGWLGAFEDPGLLEMSLVARSNHTTAELVAALDEQLDRVVAEPVTAEEIERVRARAELGLLRGLETCGGRAEQIGFFETVLGEPAGAFKRLEQIRKTTLSDLLRVARKYLRKQSRSVIEVHPLDAAKEQGS